MALVGVGRRTRRTQPTGSARVNWSNVWTRGLRNLWLTYPPNLHTRCLVSGKIASIVGSGIATIDSIVGLETPGTAGNYVTFPLSFTAVPPA